MTLKFENIKLTYALYLQFCNQGFHNGFIATYHVIIFSDYFLFKSVSMSVIQTSPLGSGGVLSHNVLQGGDSTSSIVLLKRKKKSCANNMMKVIWILRKTMSIFAVVLKLILPSYFCYLKSIIIILIIYCALLTEACQKCCINEFFCRTFGGSGKHGIF